MVNVARSVIWPQNTDTLVRAVFLYVGQGESTIILAADGNSYKTILVDINLDSTNGGIHIPRLMKDLLKDKGGKLDVFVNTHPHNDHLNGIVELSDTVEINEVWHSGHNPGKEHDDAYQNLQKVIKKVNKNGNGEIELSGSRSAGSIGEAEYYVLAPAEYVKDDIDGESAEARYRRIHEQCAVLKFGLENTWIMITGDADRDAWEKHITNYHGERLNACVFSAPHHGSRTFFKYDEDSEPYLDALEKIGPDYVIVSAPTSKESPHDHPHDDAIKLYADEVGEDNILHTGEKRHSFICDIFRDGKYQVTSDNGELAESYSIKEENDNGGGNGGKKKAAVVSSVSIPRTRVDERPMGKEK